MQQIILYDVETTGFPKTPIELQPPDVQPRIIQIYAVHAEHNEDGSEFKILDTLSSYVNSVENVPKRITEITGITIDHLVGSPTWEDLRPKFFSMVKKAGMICTHNLEFDARMVQIEELHLGFKKPFDDVKRRCTLQMSRRVNTGVKSHALGNLYKELFGDDLEGAHTADADTHALVRVYKDLLKKGAWSS